MKGSRMSLSSTAQSRVRGVLVGIVANPASGRDIRRLVAGASVVGNADKAAMVLRVLTGLRAAGVERALMMPAGDGLSAGLGRLLKAHASPTPALELVPQPLTGTAADTERAVRAMLDAGARTLVVLGGDGTHRVVTRACGDTPLCALSTGTNNAFPEWRETTVAGIAAGLVATGRGGPDALVREAALHVEREGAEPDLALVDVAATAERFAGARALWRAGDLRELIVSFADPGAVGLASLAGMLRPLARRGGRALHVRLDPDADLRLQVALAPGLIARIGVAGFRELAPGERVEFGAAGSIALDGEREIELGGGERVTVHLGGGPLRIDVDAVMAHAASTGATRFQPAPL
jgi:predicted polyphosphate/ATP-dependent NAD kinase